MPSRIRYYLPLLLAFLLCLPALGAPREEILLADFEGRDYGGWQVTGAAFGPGPAQGTLPGQMAVSGFLGRGLVNTYYQGDGTTGTLTSPEFRIARRYLSFLLGGGMNMEQTCIRLLVDGRPVRTATGPNDKPGGTERLEWHDWDVSDLEGKTARIEIIDRATGGWGHINVDHIIMSDEKQAEEIQTTPLYHETYRPQFHFTPKTGWTNDPNGLVYYRGEYHLFFQHNPFDVVWGNMTWGHAVSRDLVHWEQLPNAITPDALGTIFSGSAVVDHGNTAGFQTGKEKTLVAIYTAAGNTSPESKGQPFTQCLAYSTDRGRTWTKYAQNPVLKHIAADNRDPKVVWHAPTRRWIIALYLDKEDYALFASPDLKAWTQIQTVTVPGCGECPDFFEMPVDGDAANTRWVFTGANGRYLVGSFDGSRFTPEGAVQQVDFGANYYAVQTYSDLPAADGRRIQIAWMNGGSYPRMPFNQQMSFPCEMTLRATPEGLRLYRLPVKEIKSLYGKPLRWSGKTVTPGEDLTPDVSGDLFDIEAVFEPRDAEAFGLRARGETIRCNVKEKTLTCLGRTAPLELENGRITLRLLVDRTSLELFGNGGRVSLTSCFLPRQKAQGLRIFAEGGVARLVSLRVTPLKSAWPAE